MLALQVSEVEESKLSSCTAARRTSSCSCVSCRTRTDALDRVPLPPLPGRCLRGPTSPFGISHERVPGKSFSGSRAPLIGPSTARDLGVNSITDQYTLRRLQRGRNRVNARAARPERSRQRSVAWTRSRGDLRFKNVLILLSLPSGIKGPVRQAPQQTEQTVLIGTRTHTTQQTLYSNLR